MGLASLDGLSGLYAKYRVNLPQHSAKLPPDEVAGIFLARARAFFYRTGPDSGSFRAGDDTLELAQLLDQERAEVQWETNLGYWLGIRAYPAPDRFPAP